MYIIGEGSSIILQWKKYKCIDSMHVYLVLSFDCVRYDKLIEFLLRKDIPGTGIRLVLDSYTRLYAYIRWNNCMSTPVKMENGVKQGGVLSPTLFCIII